MLLFQGSFISSYFMDIQKKLTATELSHPASPTYNFAKCCIFFLIIFACQLSRMLLYYINVPLL